MRRRNLPPALFRQTMPSGGIHHAFTDNDLWLPFQTMVLQIFAVELVEINGGPLKSYRGFLSKTKLKNDWIYKRRNQGKAFKSLGLQ